MGVRRSNCVGVSAVLQSCGSPQAPVRAQPYATSGGNKRGVIPASTDSVGTYGLVGGGRGKVWTSAHGAGV